MPDRITPALLRIVKYADEQGGSFTVWPVGMARQTVLRAVDQKLLDRVGPRFGFGAVRYHLTDYGRRTIKESDHA